MAPAEWPDNPAPARADWRDTLRAATDLALLGIVTALASAAVLTAGAALWVIRKLIKTENRS